MRKILSLTLVALLIGLAANAAEKRMNDAVNFISEAQVAEVINHLKMSHQPIDDALTFRIERGVRRVANLWRETDGSAEEFARFCKASFVAEEEQLLQLFHALERNFEIISGNFNRITVYLRKPMHLDGAPLTPVDMIFGGYSVGAHFNADMFATRIAFLTALNFPFFSLEEKTKLGETWTRTEWAMARMGDRFTVRTPTHLQQNASRIFAETEAYTSDYNIFMGTLRTNDNRQIFPDDMRLISHWGLRDELRANYADEVNGLERQRMIFRVMQRIIDQSIPQRVINTNTYTWNPFTNTVSLNGQEVDAPREPDTRYDYFLRNIHAMKSFDPYSPYPTELQRAFEGGMEIPQADVERLFRSVLSSPLAVEVGALISQRLGRPLEPFDIWYTGFRSVGGIPQEELTAITQRKFPNAQALQDSIPSMLIQLGWQPERAHQIASLIVVEASRGIGHAWGAGMRGEPARLRTRVEEGGMDYRGYNIGIHELGHNVEQTITMNDVEYFSLTRVPNVAFTEAIAFLFQRKDLELIGLENQNPKADYYWALSEFWSCFEIMGVSLVDIAVWEWIYANPNATYVELKDAVMNIAKDVWNTYFAPVFGIRDQTVLAIYTHMIRRPLYLSNYPLGRVIDFQISQYVRGRNIADEIDRMLKQGSIIPQLWMQGAVGSQVSEQPLLDAVEEALRAFR
jgi:hypothetical protein